MIQKHRLKKENLDPRNWMRQEFMVNKQSDEDEDNSFDTKEMCEYERAEKNMRRGEK